MIFNHFFLFFLRDIMKIVSWNCAGKFREDYETIFKQNADIYVIQECEDPKDAREEYKEYKGFVEKFAGKNIFWKGYFKILLIYRIAPRIFYILFNGRNS